jgi:hypothetical protein
VIQRIRKGKGFGGCLRYVMRPGAEVLGGSFPLDASARSISVEMANNARQAERVQKPVFHAVLSLAPTEVLTAPQWAAAARSYLTSLGFEDCPWVLVRHTDTARDHVHIVASRVRHDGTVVSDSKDYVRGMSALRTLERDFSLQLPQQRAISTSPSNERASRIDSPREDHKDAKAYVVDRLQAAVAAQPTMPELVASLRQQGIEVRLRVASGKIDGISFGYAGAGFTGSSLGQEFSWRGLQERSRIPHSDAEHRHLLASPAPKQETTWSNTALGELAKGLARQATNRAGSELSRAVSMLHREGSAALRFTANALHLMHVLRAPASAVGRLCRELPGGDAVGLGLAFFGACSSPAAAVSLSLNLAARIAYRLPDLNTSDSSSARDTRLLLRTYAQTALSDSPSLGTFQARLEECGIYLRRLEGQLAFEVGNVTVYSKCLGPAFTERALELRFGDKIDERRVEQLDTGVSQFARADVAAAAQPRHRAQGAEQPGIPFGDPVLVADQRTAVRASSERPPAPAYPTASALEQSVLDPRVSDKPSAAAHLDRPVSAHLDLAAEPAALARAGRPRDGPLLPVTEARASPARGFADADESRAQVSRQLQALGGDRFDLRIERAGAPARLEVALSKEQVEARLAACRDQAVTVGIRPAKSEGLAAQFLGWADPPTLARATAAGFEPALALSSGDRLAVWIRHASTPSPVQTFVGRAVRLAWDLPPLGRGRAFGPVVGFGEARQASLVHERQAPYTQAQRLTQLFTAARAERTADLAQKLAAAGVPSPSLYRSALQGGTRTADLQWAKMALERGLPKPDALAVLAHQGSRRAASPERQLAYAVRVLSVASGDAAPALSKEVVRAASLSLGLSLRVVQMSLKVLRLGRSFFR